MKVVQGTCSKPGKAKIKGCKNCEPADGSGASFVAFSVIRDIDKVIPQGQFAIEMHQHDRGREGAKADQGNMKQRRFLHCEEVQ